MKPVCLVCLFAILINPVALARKNPVPLLNQPLVPGFSVPGRSDFTLTVRGAGFAKNATVYWNGSPRTTTFKSAVRLDATIPAADVAQPGTATVTVVNPPPGGGASNPVFFSISLPSASIGWLNKNIVTGNEYSVSIATADFNDDGNLDVALLDAFPSNGKTVEIYLGNGDATFQEGAGYLAGDNSIFTGDVNGDGEVDLVTTDSAGAFEVLLGNGDGTFRPPLKTSANPGGFVGALGDFNGDGHLDMVIHYEQSGVPSTFQVFFGNGDGTFQAPTTYGDGENLFPVSIALGDYNSDAIIDLAVVNNAPTNPRIQIYLGTLCCGFQPPTSFDAGLTPVRVVTADFNNDTHLDLAVANLEGSGFGSTVSILLGNGDGTFQPPMIFPVGPTALRLRAGVFTGDSKPDLAVVSATGLSVLAGNGDGTFKNALSFPAGFIPSAIATGDVNNDGRLDFIVANDTTFLAFSVLTQSTAALSDTNLTFGGVGVGTSSHPRNVRLTNIGSSDLSLASIIIGGTDAGDFSQQTTCGATVASGASCTITVTFTPTGLGARHGQLALTDSASSKPQVITLAGRGK
ncbi:MAG: FG-GAP-like repeat-containing protein [Acidobacteriia bacterium]|nr:FG-GAP-like repeat-containing protein [Terriglobia bacterium]